MIKRGGVDRLSVLHAAIDSVRRGGTMSLSGVYGGMVDPMPMMDLFDKQIQLRMGQANVKRWIDDLMPLVQADDDPLGVEHLATHKLPLEQAPHAYEIFQKKEDGAIKILLPPRQEPGDAVSALALGAGLPRAEESRAGTQNRP
jgi:threonine dehydrogenase-like Zn-dependent dehydrogenase